MSLIRENSVKVVILACMLIQGWQFVLTENEFQGINGQCMYAQPGSSTLVYNWKTEVFEGAGIFSDYVYTLKADAYKDYKHPPLLNKLVRRLKKANMYNPEIITRVIEMSTAKTGPNYLGCQGKDYSTDFSVSLIFDMVGVIGGELAKFQDKMIEEKDGERLFSERFKDFLNVVVEFNRGGYYHNNINRNTIAMDFKNNLFYLIDPDFATKTNFKTSKPMDFVAAFDAPNLFVPGSFRKGIDDLYSATLSFVDSLMPVSKKSQDYFKMTAEQTKNNAAKDCWTIRDDECVEFLANTYAKLLCDYMKDIGLGDLTISDKFKNVYKTTIGFNWKKVDKEQIYADLNLPTLLRDLWLYKDFPLSPAEFLELFSMVRLKRKLI